jgi:hypothetical protein
MIATNKATFGEAEECVNFVIVTIRNQNAAKRPGLPVV